MERSCSHSLQRVSSTAMPRTPRSTPVKPSCQSTQSWGSGCSTSGGGSGVEGSFSAAIQESAEGLGTALIYVCGILFVIALFMHSQHMKHKDSFGGMAGVSEVRWRDSQMTRSRYLELQIAERDNDIIRLKAELESMIAGSQIAEENMMSQDQAIRALQHKHESERMAREKAQFALIERTQAWEKCTALSKVLAREAAACAKEVADVKAMAKGTYKR